MKKILSSLILAAVVSFSFAQSSETRQLDSFDEISVAEAIKVKLIPGSTHKAEVRVDGTDLAYVLTEVRGGKLKIHMSNQQNRYKNVDVSIEVTYVDLDEIEVSSAAKLTAVEAVKTQALSIEVTSAGDARITVDVESLEAKASSAGEIEVRGTSKRQTVKCSSAGDYNGYDLQSEMADVDVSSSGDARVFVSEELKAEASSGGSVKYRGDPQVVIADSSSGGRVRKG